MVLPKLRIIFLLILVLAAGAAAGSLEDRIWSAGDLGDRPAAERQAILKTWAELDPQGEQTEAVLNRMFGINTDGLDELILQLSDPEYYIRSRAAERILTYSAREVKKKLNQVRRRDTDPETLFQVHRVLKDLDTNFYAYWEKGRRVRDNLMYLLSYRQDERFFDFARQVYMQGGDSEKELILDLSIHFPQERSFQFLSSMREHSRGAILYPLIRRLTRSGHPEAAAIGNSLLADTDLPVLLRANIAAMMPGDKDAEDRSDYVSLLRQRRIKPALKLKSDAVPAEDFLLRRPDRIMTVNEENLVGKINAIDIRGDLYASINGASRMLPLFRIEYIHMTPTAKRSNIDYLARVVLKNNDALVGDVIGKEGDSFILNCSYIRKPVRIPTQQIAYVQLNTEDQVSGNAARNSLTSPVIRMDNGDSLHGTITGCRGAFIGIRLRDYKVFRSPDRGGSRDMYLPRASVDRIDFPCPALMPSRGYCRIMTLFGDGLNGHLVEMNDEFIRLHVPGLGVLDIHRAKIAEIDFNSGFRNFKGHMLAAFAVTNTVKIFNSRGRVIWEKAGLKQPVHALRLSDGSILVCERTGQRLSRYSRDKILEQEYTGFTNVVAARELSDGNLLVTSYRQNDPLEIIDRNGQRVRAFNCFPYPSDAVMLPDGRIAAISRRSNKLVIINKDDELERNEYMVAPSCLRLMDNGNLLVSSHRSIAEYDLDLRRKNQISRFEAPKGFRHEQYIYAVEHAIVHTMDAAGNSIRRYEMDASPDYITFY